MGEYEEILPVKKADSYSMSSAQKRLFMLDKIIGTSTNYNIPGILNITGSFDIDRLQDALDQLVKREEVFRTSFHMENGEPVQKIAEKVELNIEYCEQDEISIQEEFLDFVKPFDLSEAPLARVKVVRIKDTYLLFYDIHHIISDGGSIPVMLSEITALYAGRKLPELRVQYKDFSLWQNKRKIEDQAAYWKSEFEGEIPVLDLKTDYVRPQEQSFRGATIKRRVEKRIKERVEALAKEYKATEFMVMLSAFLTMLHKYSRQQEIIVGTPISGRVHADTHQMLGMFVNTLALKGDVCPNQSFSRLLKEIKNKCLKAYDNQEYPFEELVETVQVPRDLSRNPLFDVMFVFQNNEGAEIGEGRLSIKGVPVVYTVSKFDITLSVTEIGEGYAIDFEYSTDLFSPETIELMAKHYTVLLEQALEHPNLKLEDISMLDEAEEDNILKQFNKTTVDYNKQKTIAELFEEQVKDRPDKAAVIFENRQYTYSEINRRANSLAGKLRKEFGIKPGDFIAIIAERGIEMIEAIFVAIKSGGAYVPIDPTYPEDRIDFMLADCKPKVILTACRNYKYHGTIPLINLFDESNYTDNGENLELINSASDLLYIIYTSGTTGNPKGVMVENKGVHNLINLFKVDLNITSEHVVGMFHNYIFDGSVWEIMMGLLTGSTLIVLNEDQIHDLNELRAVIESRKIDIIALPPQYAVHMKYDTVKILITAGSEASKEILSNVEHEYINSYGPTENTVSATYWRYQKGERVPLKIPIGKPAPNVSVYIRNGKELCGIGVPGELCIAGDGVARGYLNRPELTNEKFIPNPYGEGRLYYSGDLAKWLPDGTIEYLGRIDEQIKIRGFRVELAEIKYKLYEFPEIKEAIVLAREDRNAEKYLCAYLVSDKNVYVDEIKKKLQKELPDYMIPTYILQLEAIPVTRNGKPDYRALPEPNYQSTKTFIAARNPLEKEIVLAFEAILGMENVSVTDHFYDLGGDSIKAIRIAGRMKEAGYQTSVKAIMGEQTPENIAKVTKKDFQLVNAQQGEITGEVSLTAIQKEFFERGLRNPAHFNQSLLFESVKKLNMAAFRKALDKLVEHHDMLRVVFKNGVQQIERIEHKQWYDFYEYDCNVDDINDLANPIQSSIDIGQGPLLKVCVFHVSDKDYILLIVHHLVVDGVSWRILAEDLENGYRQASDGREITLPRKSTSFKAWSQELRRYRNSYKLKKEEAYWKKVNQEVIKGKILSDAVEMERVDKPETAQFILEKEYTRDLIKNSHKAYNTEMNDLMITALVRAVRKVMGQEVVAVEIEAHGREEIIENVSIERTVGWFTSAYPVVFKGIGGQIQHDICNVKEILHRIPNKGIGYQILKSIGESAFIHDAEPDIAFNYLGDMGIEQENGKTNFLISNLPHGINVAPENRFGSPISINGAVQNGILTMGITYYEHEYKADTVMNLCSQLKQELIAVVEHCRRVVSTEYTASDYGEKEWTEEEFKTAKEKFQSKGEEIQRIYPLTALQDGMLYEKLTNEDSTQYVLQHVMKFNSINVEHMRNAFEILADSHDILHTVIKYKGVKNPRQVLLKKRIPEFHYMEVSSEDEFLELKKNDVTRGFDLEEDTLIRMYVVKLPERNYRLIVTKHHIIVDGWCLSILYGNLFQYYESLESGVEIKQKHTGKYEGFVRYIEAKDKEESLIYWEKLLEDYEEQAAILPMNSLETIAEESQNMGISLSPVMTIKANEVSKKYGVTVNTLIEAVWGILLQKYNRTDDIVFGKVVSGRNAEIEGIEQMIGLFINTIPVRVKAEPGITFASLIEKLQEQALAGNEHDYCSLAEIQKRSKLGNGLIGTLMAFENYYVQAADRKEGSEEAEIGFESVREQTSYGITLSVNMGETFNFEIKYHTNKYRKDEIEWLLRHLKTLMENAINHPEEEIGRLEMADCSEIELLTRTYNKTDAKYPEDKTIVQLFEEQVEKTPDKIAIVCEGESLTYNELNQRANCLAGKLRAEYDVKPDDCIAIIANRCLEMIVGIYGIMKAGGAYVPIDPSYPKTRKEYTILDCNAKVLLLAVEENHLEIGVPVIDLLDENNYYGSQENPVRINKASDLLYIIYTSGTTGKPKGVMIEHKNLVRLLFNSKFQFDFNEDDVWTMFHSYCFDFSVWELFGSTLYGGRLVIVPKETAGDTTLFCDLLEKEKVTILNQVPSSFYNLIDITDNKSIHSIRYVIFGGEALNPGKLKEWHDNNPQCKIVNMYGITETTVHVTYKSIRKEEIASGISNIGTAIPTLSVYVRNGNELCGIGVPGELYVAGAGVARGYLNHKELTYEKFIEDPYGKGIMYRSGDLVRWRTDGNLEYLGRIDEQVKIRGFRIELKEIETRINEIQGVRAATVIVRDDNKASKYICAYVVADKEVGEDLIKRHLRKKLPGYMMPAYIMQIDELPLTANGKLDKKALPERIYRAANEYAAPRNRIEEIVVAAFEEILGVEQISIYDDFYEMGGHSLMATRLCNEIEKVCGIRIPLHDIFLASTPELIAEKIIVKEKGEYESIPLMDKANSYDVSPMQKRLYMLDAMLGASVSYNIPNVLKINKDLDIIRLQEVLNLLTLRQEVFRTSFHMENGKLVQKIAEKAEIKIEYSEESQVNIGELLREFVQPFDLSKAPLARVKAVKVNEAYFLFYDIHHIISDGESMAIMMNEIVALYKGKKLPELRVQYKDFSAWQIRKSLEKQAEYWKNEFAGEIPVLELKTDYVRLPEQYYHGANVVSMMGKNEKEKIKEIARKHKATEFMVLLSAFMAMLQKYSRQNKIIVGTPISGRVHADTSNMLGMFVNTLALQGEVYSDKSFSHLLTHIKNKCLNAYDNQEYPFEDLVEAVDVQRDIARNPLFDIMFIMHNREKEGAGAETHDLSIEGVQVDYTVAKFDIILAITDTEEGYGVNFEYCSDLFKPETMEIMAKHYITMLKHMIENPDQKLEHISMLDSDEIEKVMVEFNDTKAELFTDKTLVDLFEEQVRRTPEKIAVVSGDKQITYLEFNGRVNYLAEKLRTQYQVKSNEFVAIIAERSLDMLVGIYAVLKAGGAYVPLDPDYPSERIDFILKDCRPKAVLRGTGEFKITENCVQIDLTKEAGKINEAENLEHINHAEDLAYVIYTSGTTGVPKGTMIEHHNVVNLLTYVIRSRALNEDSVILQKTSNVFDVSVWELFAPLLCGGRIVVLPNGDEKDPEKIAEAIEEYKVTELSFVPSMFKAFNAEIKENDQRLRTLTGIQIAGEALPAELVNSYKAAGELVNFYGPTEDTVYATEYLCTRGVESIPIGKPISNTLAYILDGLELCGIGVPGELCLAGDGVARGYLNRPELTASKFIKNPFGEGRLYRSGDLVRWLPDGNIDYLGRMDEQVKIRGFRIELGEIESRLHEIEEIKEAAVIAKDGEDHIKFLCAYIVSDHEIDGNQIKDKLRKKMPGYMIPSSIMQIEAIPVTSNGKLDRKALPEPQFHRIRELVAPRNTVEKIVVEAFEGVLGISGVSITDGFFELGGDSIKAILIAGRMKEVGYKTSAKIVLAEQTPVNIAKVAKKSIDIMNAVQGEVTGEVPLMAIQKDFFESGLINLNHFNQSVLYECAERMNVEALHKTAEKLVEHHDMLRAVFINGIQKIGGITDKDWYAFYEFSCSIKDIHELAGQIQENFDISKGPLMNIGLFHTSERDYLLFVIHHLVVDGVSWRIISEDLESGYCQAKSGQEIQLLAKTTSFKDWSEAICDYRNSYRLKKEEKYWQQINQEVAAGKLKINGDRSEKEGKVNTAVFTLGKRNTSHLLRNCNKAYNTEINDLMLTALTRAIYHVMRQNTIAVIMEGHGREEISSKVSIERTVGWFTTEYPVLFNNIGQEIEQDIRNVKETLRKVPNKGIGYGILKNIGDSPINADAIPDVTFNYLGELDAGIQKESSIFTISHLPHGLDIEPANRFGTRITINGAVQDGVFSMGIIYCENDYKVETMESLGKEFVKELAFIVEHCSQVEVTEYTASDYGELEWTEKEFQASRIKLELKGGEIKRIYPLTPMQEGLLFEKLSDIESTQYVNQQTMKFKNINTEYIQEAFRAVVAKHDILHTVIKYRGVSVLRQILLKERPPEFRYREVVSEEEYLKIRKEDVKRGFDLEDDTLIRLQIVKIAENDYRLILTNHHIVADGWCMPILYGDLFRYYKELEKGNTIIEEQAENYEEFVRYIESKDKEKSLLFWEKLLEDYEARAEILPIGQKVNQEDENTRMDISLSREISHKAVKVCADCGVTINTLIEAAWGILLQKYNQTNDVVFGKVVSGRNAEIAGIENMIGLFINTVPVRVQSEMNDSIKTLLRKLQDQAVAGNEHDYCPLAEIQGRSSLKSSLFGTIMVFENYYVQNTGQNNGGIEVEAESTREQTNYGISLSANMGETLNLGIMYSPLIYGKEEVELLLEHLQILIENAVNNPDTKVEELIIISSAEEEKVIKLFNDSDSAYPTDKTIADIFQEQVSKTPDKKAVVFGNEMLTYEELNKKANRLAHKLRLIGVKPDDFVAIVMENSIEMLIAIYGIIKSGGAYVPVDLTYPEERIYYIIKDCNPKAVIMNQKDMIMDVPVIDISDINTWEESIENPKIINKPEDLAYCIYTSGTTGKPKGVMIEHTGVINLREYFRTKQGINSSDQILQFANFTFDATISEMCMSILSGATMYMVTKEIQNSVKAFESFVEKHGITIGILPPQYLSQVRLKKFRTIITAGSETNKILVESNRDIPVYSNDYGPTEATVCATYWRHSTGDTVPDRIPIGKPINNKKIYILNGDRACGIGIVGEMCIVGIGLARGYLNMPELTAEKFTDNPFGEGKMYRTGDLARWLPDGNIDYLGRMDEQVKIRGFRIELGEIESRICEIERVKEAAAVALRDKMGDQYLCVYVILNEETDTREITEALRHKIPGYMMPSCIMKVDQIPLTKSNKVDKKALPNPIYQRKEEYIAPRTPDEKMIADAFQAVLGIKNISVTDNFFDLGGDSIKAIRVTSYISNDRVSVRTILNERSPEKIAAKLKEVRTDEMMFLMNQDRAKQDSKPAVFMISSIEGYASILNNIVKDMNYDGFIYGINDPKFYVTDINNLQNSFDYTVDAIYDEIYRLFKDGDILVGYSYGAKLLPLVAYLLEKSGRKVSKIFVLDTVINQLEGGMIGEAEKLDLSKLYVERYLGKKYNSEEFGNSIISILTKISEIMSGNSKAGFETIYKELERAFEVHVSNNKNNVIFRSKIQADIMAVFSNTIMKLEPDKCFEWADYTKGKFEYELIDCEHGEIVKEKSRQVSEFIMNHIDLPSIHNGSQK